MVYEIIQALLQCIEKYPDGKENKDWFTRLFQDSLNKENSSTTDTGLIYNATVIEHLLATLLAIDIKTVVKIRMVHKIVITLWEENNWDLNELNKYMLDEKPITTIDMQPQSSTQPEEAYLKEFIPIEETNSEEIEMGEPSDQTYEIIDNKITKSQSSNNELNTTIFNNEVIGNSITTIHRYETRNRTYNPKNPYYITKNQNIRLGALSVSVPGDNQKEQLAFLSNIFKLPLNSDLIQQEFWNGNSWITAGFDYEEDLELCLNKINKKEKDIIDLIRLTTKDRKQTPHKIATDQDVTNKTVNNNKTSIKPMPTEAQYIRIKTKKREEENPCKITNNKTNYKGGFSTKDIPGKNRKEKIDYIMEILELDYNNNYLYPSFHKNKSWIIVYFNNSNDLDTCINVINRKYGDTIQMTKLNKEQNERKTTYTTENLLDTTKQTSNTQTYTIKDIPKEYSNERIKGAFKPYGKICNLKTTINKTKQEKEVQVILEQSNISKDLSNCWSIPMGSIMARIAPTNACPEVWNDRNKFTARLYGIPKATNTVLLTRSIKNLKPKTCFIPKCSISKKERKFAIIGFQSQEDLNKACISAAKYYNYKLSWSKTRSTNNKDNNNTKGKLEKKSRTEKEIIEMDQTSIMSISSPTLSPKSSNSSITKQKAKNSEEELMGIDLTSDDNMSTTSISTTSHHSIHTRSMQGPSKGKNKPTKNIREKGKQKEADYSNYTTDKLILLISQISLRLDNIENNMGIGPNRS